jgi:hypothetical protein
MKFFIPCWIALSAMFPKNPSKSYVHKQSKKVADRIYTCNRVATIAESEDLDPILLIALAFHESRFSNVTSRRNAKGPLGAIAKWHCPKNKKCDYVRAGVQAFNKFLTLNYGDRCTAIAQFNRGLNGKCEEGRSEFYYATQVLSLYDDLCTKSQMCQGC